jgi:hypothetical protein
MADWNWWPRFHDPSLRLPLRAQASLHWDANVRMLRDWRACWTFVWISLLPVPLLAAATIVGTRGLMIGNAGANAWLGLGLALLLLYLLLQHVAFAAAMRRTYVPFVRMSLSALGHPVCMRCGHLQGPAAPATCPECGAAAADPG